MRLGVGRRVVQGVPEGGGGLVGVAREKLGAAEGLGALDAQPVRESGAWGQLAAGTSVSTLSPLFPRVEQA